MPYTKICVAAALQRYLDITPIAVRTPIRRSPP